MARLMDHEEAEPKNWDEGGAQEPRQGVKWDPSLLRVGVESQVSAPELSLVPLCTLHNQRREIFR